MSREIVTLQFGPFANAIASHYWNLQAENFAGQDNETYREDYTSSLFRRGSEKLSSVPRTLIFDFRGLSALYSRLSKARQHGPRRWRAFRGAGDLVSSENALKD
jgi:hypothetical protein